MAYIQLPHSRYEDRHPRLRSLMQEPILQTVEPQLEESQIAYSGWKVVLAGFFGVMVSFAAIVPYTCLLYTSRCV